MSRFFRTLRHAQLTEGKTLAYLKYAVGEILLLVIGILIALQVNNWNQQRQLQSKADAALHEVLRDLDQVIDAVDVGIADGQRREAVMARIMAGQATGQDYLDNRLYRTVQVGGQSVGFQHSGFDKLSLMADQLPQSRIAVFESLKRLHQAVDDVEGEFGTGSWMADAIRSINERYARQYGWYHSFADSPDGDYLDFVLHDPLYRNDIVIYRVNHENYLQSLRSLKYQAILAYRQVHDLLGSTTPMPEAALALRQLPVAQLQRFAGRYRQPAEDGQDGRIVTLALRGEQLFGDGPGRGWELFMTSDNSFVHAEDGRNEYRFTQDENGVVDGIDVVEAGEVMAHWTKLEDIKP